MLEDKDIQKIGEELGKVIEQNINPQFDEIRERIDALELNVTTIKSEMVTKSYLDDKLANLEGGLIGKLRKEDAKINRLIEFLKEKNILGKQELEELKEYQIFPRM